MPGFYVSNCGSPQQWRDVSLYDFREDSAILDQYQVNRKVVDHFIDDKAFSRYGKYFVVTDGVCLNSEELQRQHFGNTTAEQIITLFENFGSQFPDKLRGSFSGAVFDAEKSEWFIYTNHCGNKPVFYYEQAGKVIVSSSPVYIADALRSNGLILEVNNNSVYNLLSYGYMIGTDTLIKQIKRLPYGSYLIIDKNGKVTIGTYYRMNITYDEVAELDRIIDEMDRLFVAAVKREYDKDTANGCEHIAQLSGGLDSRYSVWVAEKRLNCDVLCYCFSQSDTLDQKISQKIAEDLNAEYIFKSLDNGNMIKHLEQCFLLNYGLCCFSGQFPRYAFDECINFRRYGLLHTGQLGGVIAGSYVNKNTAHSQFTPESYANSRYLIRKTKNDYSQFETPEIFALTQRGFNGILCTDFIYDVASPYLDVDFMSYCLKLPLSIRQKQNGIFRTLLCEKYPEMASYKWEKTNCPLTYGKLRTTAAKVLKYGLYESFVLFVNKIGLQIRLNDHMKKKSSMNPYDYWYAENTSLKEFMDGYIEDNLPILPIESNLKEDMLDMYKHTSAREKVTVLSAVCAIKKYLIEE